MAYYDEGNPRLKREPNPIIKNKNPTPESRYYPEENPRLLPEKKADKKDIKVYKTGQKKLRAAWDITINSTKFVNGTVRFARYCKTVKAKEVAPKRFKFKRRQIWQ